MPATRSVSFDKKQKSTSLRQGKLLFAASKRSTSGSDLQKKKPQIIAPPTIENDGRDDESSSSSDASDHGVVDVDAMQLSLTVVEGTDAYKKAHKAVVKARDGRPLVHSEGQTRTHAILRVFDLSYEYGPCVGVTRLERWERAELLGLNPPQAVKDILLSKEGTEDASLSQSVFYAEEV